MKSFRSLLLFCSFSCFAGCGAKGSEVITPPKGETPAAPNPAAITAILAKADAVDGTTDKIVHKCAGCALHMDGKAEHSVVVEGYTLHLCKPACLERYKADAAGELLKLKID